MELLWFIMGLAAATMALLATTMAGVLGWADRAFHVRVDPLVEAVNAALPGANCGGCGYVGCREYAEAIVRGEVAVNLCAVGGPSCASEIAAIMGVEVDESWPLKAVVHCAATRSQRLGRREYRGVQTCAAASMVSGVQGCTYGCLGFGDCVAACDYHAIEVVDGLARVRYENCIGCRACADACPRNIISMLPFKSEQMLVVACCNRDAGKDVMRVCKVGCIGCKLCDKNSDLIRMSGNLPEIEYDRYDPVNGAAPFSVAVEKCPMESLVYVGGWTDSDLAATTSERTREPVEDSCATMSGRTMAAGGQSPPTALPGEASAQRTRLTSD